MGGIASLREFAYRDMKKLFIFHAFFFTKVTPIFTDLHEVFFSRKMTPTMHDVHNVHNGLKRAII